MDWFTSIAVYLTIWWVALFAVLPIGTQPVEQADSVTGWRGAPALPRLWMKFGLTTMVACVVWLIVFGVIESGWLSFRDGLLAAPNG